MAGQRLRFKRAAKESVECVGGEDKRIVARRSLLTAARATKREDERRMSTLLIGATHSKVLAHQNNTP